jgi:hypothetical protein
VLDKNLVGVSPSVSQKVLHDNAATLFHIVV